MTERPPTILDTARRFATDFSAFIIPGGLESLLRRDGDPRPLTGSEKLISACAKTAVLLPPALIALGLVTQNLRLTEWGVVVAASEAIAFTMAVIHTHFNAS